MKLNTLSLAIFLGTCPFSVLYAGGLDRSGQSIAAFLQPGNYLEAGISVVDPTVRGRDESNHTISDMADDYYFPQAAIKIQATDQISVGLIYDQPYGADSIYAIDGSNFANATEGTKVKVRTNNITALIGYQPNSNWNIYAGPVWQTVKANIKTNGIAYKSLSNYQINVSEEEAYGWLAGFAYQIPEIALKASVTYRSEITHNAKSVETSNLPAYAGVTGRPELSLLGYIAGQTQAVTPQSVNIDLQSGIAANTLAFANLRWVHWDQFTVTPPLLNFVGQNLISYSDDQYSITTGLSHKFSDQWAGTVAVGFDSGAGNPVTTLGPTEGYWSVGLGGQYSPSENTFIQAGVKYFWLGDATAQTGGFNVGEFENNDALGYGLKIGYRF